jgi:pyrroloquinoline-quinone synthase
MSQTPYGPDDLAVPPLSGAAFLELLDDNYTRKTDAQPAFYRELFAGNVSREQLKSWLVDQYFYWDHLYFSTAAIYIKTNEATVRGKLLPRLVFIEGRNVVRDIRPEWTTPSYDELLARLGEALGVSRVELEDSRPFARTFFSVSTLCMYSRGWEWSWLDGIANLYASDLYYLELLPKVRAVLSSEFGVAEEALEFFDAVRRDAEENLVWEKEVLSYWTCTTERQLTAARAFRERLDIEAQCLVGLGELVGGGQPFQAPKGAQIPSLVGNEITPIQTY